MCSRQIKIWIFGVGLGISASGGATSTYTVRPRDTLSEIARSLFPGPAYGPQGSLKKIEILNPQITNLNVIFAGQKILFSIDYSKADEIHSEPAVSSAPPSMPLPSVPVVPINSSFNLVTLTTGFSFFRINATDPSTQGTALILSNANFLLQGEWTQAWSTTWQSLIKFRYFKTDVADPTPRQMARATDSLLGSAYGIRYLVRPELSLWSEISFEQQMFVTNASAQSLNLEKVPISAAGVGVRSVFLRSALFGFAGELSGKYLFATSASAFSVNGGSEYGAGFFLESNSREKKFSLNAGAQYLARQQNTSIVQQKWTEIISTVGFVWRMDP